MFSMREGRSGTYFLNVEEGGRNRSAFSMREGRGSTYKLNIKDRGRDRSAFSVRGGGHSGIYALNIKDGGRDCLLDSGQQHLLLRVNVSAWHGGDVDDVAVEPGFSGSTSSENETL
ncbi:hypothetical protein B0H14DRAFT_2563977 [Mycena olivaceomarginata]|nr:hypothetical protein B0H14DRAFT_2563977 [Mycena olivaceomarginata]